VNNNIFTYYIILIISKIIHSAFAVIIFLICNIISYKNMFTWKSNFIISTITFLIIMITDLLTVSLDFPRFVSNLSRLLWEVQDDERLTVYRKSVANRRWRALLRLKGTIATEAHDVTVAIKCLIVLSELRKRCSIWPISVINNARAHRARNALRACVTLFNKPLIR